MAKNKSKAPKTTGERRKPSIARLKAELFAANELFDELTVTDSLFQQALGQEMVRQFRQITGLCITNPDDELTAFLDWIDAGRADLSEKEINTRAEATVYYYLCEYDARQDPTRLMEWQDEEPGAEELRDLINSALDRRRDYEIEFGPIDPNSHRAITGAIRHQS